MDYIVSNIDLILFVIINVVDGLLVNDKYGNLVFFIVELWIVLKDGLIYIYKICKDVKWVIVEGEEYVFVIVKDFVIGLKYVVDGKLKGFLIVSFFIKGLEVYIKGEISDFLIVGVKVFDD